MGNHHKQTEDSDLPRIDIQFAKVVDTLSISENELSIDVSLDKLNLINKLCR